MKVDETIPQVIVVKWIARTVGETVPCTVGNYNTQFHVSTIGQLMHSLQAEPVIIVDVTKAMLLFLPRSVEAETTIILLLNYCSTCCVSHVTMDPEAVLGCGWPCEVGTYLIFIMSRRKPIRTIWHDKM